MHLSRFLLLHLRHTTLLFVAVRVASILLARFAGTSASSVVMGGGSIVLTVLLAYIDRRRAGAPDLFANLGYGARELAMWSAIVAIALECAGQLLVSVWK